MSVVLIVFFVLHVLLLLRDLFLSCVVDFVLFSCSFRVVFVFSLCSFRVFFV